MPALTVDDIKAQIILEIGDLDARGDPPANPADGLLAQQIDTLWDRFAAKDRLGSGVRELYVRQAGLRMMLGVLAPRKFDAGDSVLGVNFKANQLWQHYRDALGVCQTEIATIEQRSTTRRGWRSGGLRTAIPGRVPLPRDPNPRVAAAARAGYIDIESAADLDREGR